MKARLFEMWFSVNVSLEYSESKLCACDLSQLKHMPQPSNIKEDFMTSSN